MPPLAACCADSGTNWDRDWQRQSDATAISGVQASVVIGLKTKTISITATCFQCHDHARRAGLKIRSVTPCGFKSHLRYSVHNAKKLSQNPGRTALNCL